MSAYGKHFVMVYSQDGMAAWPLVDQEGEVKLYITASDARSVAESHAVCLAFGYEIHCMGSGEV